METAADVIEAFCDLNGYRFYADYSGRGMFGSTCVGIVIHTNELNVMIDLADYIRDTVEDCESAADFLGRSICQDSLGLDKIIYFPHIQANEE